METLHRFPPRDEYRRAVVIRVVEYRGSYHGRWDTRRECIFGEPEGTPEGAAASAYTAFLLSRGIDPC